MAGHSKWANIQHRKSRQDAKKGKEFTKAAKEIILAAKGGGDPARPLDAAGLDGKDPGSRAGHPDGLLLEREREVEGHVGLGLGFEGHARPPRVDVGDLHHRFLR